MMKGKGTAGWIVVVGGLLLLGGCTGSESDKTDLNSQLQQLKTSLDATTSERDLLQQDVKKLRQELAEADSALAEAMQTNARFQGQIQDLTQSRDALSTKVEELMASRDQLQTTVNGLVDTRGTLEKQVAALTKARDAACADAADAQTKIEQLTERLKSQTQQMIELQDQMTAVRSVLQQLRQKLE